MGHDRRSVTAQPKSNAADFAGAVAARAVLALGVLAAACLAFSATTARSAAPIVYPSQGQSLEQQSADEAKCRQWAQQQTGFNPSSGPPTASGSAQPNGQMVRGAARGAALGAVGGAIAGDAGKGAAVGAGVGAASGFLNRRADRRQQAHAQDQATEQYSAKRSDYERAFGACMTGNGYTIK
jgi:hypothetical protein